MTIDKIRTSDGAEHAINYEALENLPVIYCKESILLENAELNNVSDLALDMSSYLPADEQSYMVWFNFNGTPYEDCFIRITLASSLDIVSPGYVYDADNISTMLWTSANLIVGPDRQVVLRKGASDAYKGLITVSAIRYQKVNAVKVEG